MSLGWTGSAAEAYPNPPLSACAVALERPRVIEARESRRWGRGSPGRHSAKRAGASSFGNQ